MIRFADWPRDRLRAAVDYARLWGALPPAGAPWHEITPEQATTIEGADELLAWFRERGKPARVPPANIAPPSGMVQDPVSRADLDKAARRQRGDPGSSPGAGRP